MPAKGFLTQEQQEKLQKSLKEEEHPEIRERVLILLLLNDGKKQIEIQQFLSGSLRKVAYWCVHGDPEKFNTLKDQRMEENHKKVTDKYIELLLQTIDRELNKFGYEFGRWTTARLAVYLETQTGIKLSGSQVRRILAKQKRCDPAPSYGESRTRTKRKYVYL